jgi:LacI family transcriptional regulator
LSNRLRNRSREDERSTTIGRRVRLADVARHARVSPSTASRALNGRGELAPQTRAAVLEAAAALGFRPSPFARSLRTRRSSMVGLIVPDAGHPFYAAVLKGAQAVLEEVGYRLSLLETRHDDPRAVEALGTLLDHHAEGVLAATAGAWVDQLTELSTDTPAVFIDDVPDGIGAGSVQARNAEGVRALVDHLVEHGHRRIGLLVGPDRTGRERHDGFHDALAAHGLEPGRGTVRRCEWSMASGFGEGRALLELRSRPTAVVAGSIELALGVIAASRSRRVAIPADVALAGFDDPYFAALLDPALTAVGYDATAMGARAARMLVDAIDGVEAPYRAERVDVRLVARRSCGCEHDFKAEFLEVAA